MSSSPPKFEIKKVNDIICRNNGGKINSKSFINKYYKENDDCTFKPCIYKNKKYMNKSHYGSKEELLSKINEDMRIKKAKIEFLRNVQEKKEMSECVFHPKINKTHYNFDNTINFKGNTVKRGESSYLNLMKLRMERKKHEERNKKYIATDDIFRNQKPFNYNTYQNYRNTNNYIGGNNVYIRKNISRNYSYTNRNKNYSINDNEVSNNRIIINKLIMEEK